MLPRLEYDLYDRLEDSRFYPKAARPPSRSSTISTSREPEYYPPRPPPRQTSSPSLIPNRDDYRSISPTMKHGRLPSPSLPPSPTPQARFQYRDERERYYDGRETRNGGLEPQMHSKRGRKLPMAQLLAAHRSTAVPVHPNENRRVRGLPEGVKPPIEEEELLRDVIYLLQGIDGKWVRFKGAPLRELGEEEEEEEGSDGGSFGGEEERGGGGGGGGGGGRKVEVAGVDEKVEEREGGIWVVEDSVYSIPPTTLDLLHRLGELGFLYRKISQAILTAPRPVRRHHHHRPLSNLHPHAAAAPSAGSGGGGGMVLQSLHHALQKELQEYYRTIAILESRLSLPTNADSLASPSKHSKPSSQTHSTSSQQLLAELEEGGLTLKRVCVWTSEVRLRMRTMSVLLEGSKSTHGGSLISLLHSYTSTGDPFLLKFTTSLLSLVSIPFFKTLSLWIYEGELQDPFDEFFVEVNPEMRDGLRREGWEDEGFGGRERGKEEGGGRREWEGKFGFREGMVPSFVERGFAKKIFSTGKSLNFIKYSCGDKDWIVTRNKLSTDASRGLSFIPPFS
ncbi:hypothetical protein BT69DRAFT_1338073 [Atractiella rhizophila]|nr:hypothetical protein BT69DRAFT_1338073 [Atractiella rhizophila]